MAFDRQAASAAGYSEEEIDAYLQTLPPEERQSTSAPTTAAAAEPPPPPTAPLAQAGEGSIIPALATAGLAAAAGAKAVGLPTAVAYGLRGGFRKGAEVMDLARTGVNALQQQAATYAQTEARLQQRPGFGGPVNPATMPTAAPMPTPAANPNMLQRAMQYVAASKVLPMAGAALSRGLPAAQAAAGLFYTSPEEIAILKAAEERKRRAQMGQPQ